MKKENISCKNEVVFMALAVSFVSNAFLAISVFVYEILGFAARYLGRSFPLSMYWHDIYEEDGRFFIVLKRYGEVQ